MSIKTVIIEDNPETRLTIKNIFKENFPDFKVLGEAGNVNDGYAIIKEHNPDFAILDIDIIEGTTFDILKRVKEEGPISFQFVFLTAHNSTENSIKALRYAALDFLVKPIDLEALKESLVIVKEKYFEKTDQNKTLDILLGLLENPFNQTQQIAIQSLKNKIEYCSIQDIIYIEGDGSISNFYLTNGSKIVGNKNLGSYNKPFVVDFDFFKVDQSIIINLLHLQSYKHSDKTIELKNGQQLIASRNGGRDLRKHLSEFDPKKLNNNYFRQLLNSLRA